MSEYIENLTPEEWEKFCEIMLRFQYTSRHFWKVPDNDHGDLGLEFFTSDGTLFQCYYPEQNIDMATYKKKMQKKINNDLKKIKKNESEISKLLDDIDISQWVLVTPELKSKELIKYCHKKKKEILKENISFIDGAKFIVKIETADSFPSGKLYAQGIHGKPIDIPISGVSEQEMILWQKGHSDFSNNIERKSNAYIGPKSKGFKDEVVTKFIQIERFLDQLREEHPDLHDLVEDSARAQLENMKEKSLFEDVHDKRFVKKILDSNKDAFSKHSKFLSDKNMQSLSFGYLSKWLAECYMDFKNE